MIDITKIKQEILNFLKRVEHKLPNAVEEAAQWGDAFVTKAETFLTSGTVMDVMAIVPELEPDREAIVAILQELEVGFKALESTFQQKGSLLVANARLVQLKVPGIEFGNAMTAAQVTHDKNKA